jgi:hypothetical protein
MEYCDEESEMKEVAAGTTRKASSLLLDAFVSLGIEVWNNFHLEP